MIYDRKFNNSSKSRKELSDDIPLKHIYKISRGAKKILLQDIDNIGDNFLHNKHKLISTANDPFRMYKRHKIIRFYADYIG